MYPSVKCPAIPQQHLNPFILCFRRSYQNDITPETTDFIKPMQTAWLRGIPMKRSYFSLLYLESNQNTQTYASWEQRSSLAIKDIP